MVNGHGGKFESDRYNAYYPYPLIYGFGNKIIFSKHIKIIKKDSMAEAISQRIKKVGIVSIRFKFPAQLLGHSPPAIHQLSPEFRDCQ